MNFFQMLRIKIRINCTPVWNQLSVNHIFNIPPDTQYYFDDFGRLTGNEPMFRGVRVAVVDPFFITCDNSPDTSIIHGITDKLTTYPLYVESIEVSIHEVQIYSFCMIFQVSESGDVWYLLMHQVLVTAFEYLFADFLPKLCVYSQYPII